MEVGGKMGACEEVKKKMKRGRSDTEGTMGEQDDTRAQDNGGAAVPAY